MCITDLYTKHLNKQVEHYWNIYHFDMSPNYTSHNNEADAFKHCYFQAELTLWLGKWIANLIGLNHENKPNNPPKEKEMDLHNNAVGQQIGQGIKKENKFWLFTNYQDNIAKKIIDSMNNGLLITKIESED